MVQKKKRRFSAYYRGRLLERVTKIEKDGKQMILLVFKSEVPGSRKDRKLVDLEEYLAGVHKVHCVNN